MGEEGGAGEEQGRALEGLGKALVEEGLQILPVKAQGHDAEHQPAAQHQHHEHAGAAPGDGLHPAEGAVEARPQQGRRHEARGEVRVDGVQEEDLEQGQTGGGLPDKIEEIKEGRGLPREGLLGAALLQGPRRQSHEDPQAHGQQGGDGIVQQVGPAGVLGVEPQGDRRLGDQHPQEKLGGAHPVFGLFWSG